MDRYDLKTVNYGTEYDEHEMFLDNEGCAIDTLNDACWFIVEQWTGLYDKNGTKIFEGDILATENDYLDYDVWDEADYGYTIVQYKDLGFCCSNWEPNPDISEDCESVYSLKFVKVIGDTYDNSLRVIGW